MRASLILPVALLCGSAAMAAETRPAHGGRGAPAAAAAKPAGSTAKMVGKFDDWTAATHAEAGSLVCYAFTRMQAGGGAAAGSVAVPGRGDVVMTVTQRQGGRDAVAVTAGYAYPTNAEATLQVERAELPLYTSGRSAFARDGHAVVTAFDKGGRATMRGPGPKGGTVVDTFSLRGFSQAYAAINKACPAK